VITRSRLALTRARHLKENVPSATPSRPARRLPTRKGRPETDLFCEGARLRISAPSRLWARPCAWAHTRNRQRPCPQRGRRWSRRAPREAAFLEPDRVANSRPGKETDARRREREGGRVGSRGACPRARAATAGGCKVAARETVSSDSHLAVPRRCCRRECRSAVVRAARAPDTPWSAPAPVALPMFRATRGSEGHCSARGPRPDRTESLWGPRMLRGWPGQQQRTLGPRCRR